jgi:hypothetical protein
VRFASGTSRWSEHHGLDAVPVRAREARGPASFETTSAIRAGDLPFLAGDRERLHVGAAPADQDADPSAPAHARDGSAPAGAASYSTPGFPFTIVPDAVVLLSGRVEVLLELRGLAGAPTGDHADPHVEDAVHLPFLDRPRAG